MPILVIAEHDNAGLKAATLNTVTAAARLGGDIDVLVAGVGCASVAQAAARLAGVARVKVADAVPLAHRPRVSPPRSVRMGQDRAVQGEGIYCGVAGCLKASPRWHGDTDEPAELRIELDKATAAAALAVGL